MKLPSISVIVPVYQQTEYLKECIESIIRQNIEDIQLVIVDDGSDESVAQYCDYLAQQHKCVEALHKQNGGVASARNYGISVAKGEYVAFVDCDDWVFSNMHTFLLEMAQTNDADIVLCGISRLKAGKKLEKIQECLRNGEYKGESIKENLIYPLCGVNPNKKDNRIIHASACRGIYRRELMESADICFEEISYSEDLLFNLEMFSKAKKIIVKEDAMYAYRQNSYSATEAYNPKRFNEAIESYGLLLQGAAQCGLNKQEYEPRMAWWFLGQMSVVARISVQKSKGNAWSTLKRIFRGKDVKMARSKIGNVLNIWPVPLRFFCLLI